MQTNSPNNTKLDDRLDTLIRAWQRKIEDARPYKGTAQHGYRMGVRECLRELLDALEETDE